MAKRAGTMRLSAPRVITFWIAVLLALLGVIAVLAPITSLVGYALWLVVAGFVSPGVGQPFGRPVMLSRRQKHGALRIREGFTRHYDGGGQTSRQG